MSTKAAKAETKPTATQVAEAKTVETKKYIDPWAGKERDKFGFVKGTKTALIVDMLTAKKYTKEQILKTLNDKYPGANNKTTLSCLLGDLQKPVGTYSAARGLKVVEDKKKHLSISK